MIDNGVNSYQAPYNVLCSELDQLNSEYQKIENEISLFRLSTQESDNSDSSHEKLVTEIDRLKIERDSILISSQQIEKNEKEMNISASYSDEILVVRLLLREESERNFLIEEEELVWLIEASTCRVNILTIRQDNLQGSLFSDVTIDNIVAKCQKKFLDLGNCYRNNILQLINSSLSHQLHSQYARTEEGLNRMRLHGREERMKLFDSFSENRRINFESLLKKRRETHQAAFSRILLEVKTRINEHLGTIKERQDEHILNFKKYIRNLAQKSWNEFQIEFDHGIQRQREQILEATKVHQGRLQQLTNSYQMKHRQVSEELKLERKLYQGVVEHDLELYQTKIAEISEFKLYSLNEEKSLGFLEVFQRLRNKITFIHEQLTQIFHPLDYKNLAITSPINSKSPALSVVNEKELLLNSQKLQLAHRQRSFKATSRKMLTLFESIEKMSRMLEDLISVRSSLLEKNLHMLKMIHQQWEVFARGKLMRLSTGSTHGYDGIPVCTMEKTVSELTKTVRSYAEILQNCLSELCSKWEGYRVCDGGLSEQIFQLCNHFYTTRFEYLVKVFNKCIDSSILINTRQEAIEELARCLEDLKFDIYRESHSIQKRSKQLHKVNLSLQHYFKHTGEIEASSYQSVP